MRKQLKSILAIGGLLLLTSGAYAANDPIANAEVVVRSPKDGSILLKTRTDAYGQVLLGTMHAGSYVIEVPGGEKLLEIVTHLNQRQKASLRDLKSNFADKDSQIVVDIKRQGDAEGVSIFRNYNMSQAGRGLRFDFTVSPAEETAFRAIFMTLTVKDALEIDAELSC